jgi:methylmalonyl-CoA mutase
LFEVNSEVNQVELRKLIKDIDFKHCSISFQLAEPAPSFLRGLREEDLRLTESTYFGAVYARKASFFQPDQFDEWLYFKTAVVRMDGANAVDELSSALKGVVDYATHVPESGKERFFENVTFIVEISNHFFENIAKLKALYLLWNQLLKAYRVGRYITPTIHALSVPWVESNQQHSNLIKGTTAALSAVLGGCTALTVEPENEHHAMMVRIARNVSNILRDEAHLSKVIDPTAGAYYLDYLTQQFAQQAWNKMIQSHEG